MIPMARRKRASAKGKQIVITIRRQGKKVITQVLNDPITKEYFLEQKKLVRRTIKKAAQKVGKAMG